MAGFGGMHEERRGAGGGQRRGDLAADMAGLAHTRDDHPALALQAHGAGARETRVQLGHQGGDRPGFDLERPPAGRDQGRGIG